MPLLVLLSLLLVLPQVWPSAAVAAAWGWPLDGRPEVTRGFDPPAVRYAAGHRGVDLAAAPGAVVRAAGAGRVGYAGLLAGRGVVTVVHGDLRTTYEPVTAAVRVGQRVAVGDVLGTLAPGHPGCPAAACLHWGLLRGDTYLDPLSLVGRGPVRLLPFAGQEPRARPRAHPGDTAPAAGQPASGGAGQGRSPLVLGALTLTGIALATARGSG